jgi:hypothetical protein
MHRLYTVEVQLIKLQQSSCLQTQRNIYQYRMARILAQEYCQCLCDTVNSNLKCCGLRRNPFDHMSIRDGQ